MTSTRPKISVLMAVYNGSRYLGEAIDSILQQTYTDFEFLILDDGSTDETPHLLQRYAALDARIHILNRPNQGLTRSLNQMLSLARGEFIARMDADDVALPDRFVQQVKLLESDSQIACVGGSYDIIDDRGEWLFRVELPESDAEIQQQLLSGQTAIQHPCAMMRRITLEQVGGYDETLKTSQDIDLWLRIGEVGTLANVPQVILKYRVHEQSVSGRKLRQQSQNVKLACERAWKRRGVQGTCEDAELRYHRFMIWCGWQMYEQARWKTALSYGVRALKVLPFNVKSWKLLLYATIKPLFASVAPGKF